MFGWYRELLEIRRENNRENELIETLKHEIEMLRLERDTLLNHALRNNQTDNKPVAVTEEFKPIPARNMPWNVRRQMLEREDREAAKLLKKNQQSEAATKEPITIAELEKELDIVADEREGELKMPFGEVMKKFKENKLHSGSKDGPKVKDKKQAVAIMLNEKKKADSGDKPEYKNKKKKGQVSTGPSPDFMKKFAKAS